MPSISYTFDKSDVPEEKLGKFCADLTAGLQRVWPDTEVSVAPADKPECTIVGAHISRNEVDLVVARTKMDL